MRLEETELSKQTIGAAGELLVAVDLLARGWHVYRNVSSAGCDLMAYKLGRTLRIEVKTAATPSLQVFEKYPGCVLAMVPAFGDIWYRALDDGKVVEVNL